MIRGYRYRLYPTKDQIVLLNKTFGCCRYVYNWALKTKDTEYKTNNNSLSSFDLMKLMKTQLKSQFEWLKEVNSQSLQQSIHNLDTAYTNFFRNPKKVGFPQYKKRRNKQSFQCPQHCTVDFIKGTIYIPKVKYIPAVLHRRFNGTVKTVTISKTPSGEYYASVLVDTNMVELPLKEVNPNTSIGIDLGIKSLAVCSNGKTYENQHNLKNSLNRLALYQKRLSKKEKGSSNYNKTRIKVAKVHETIANKRRDYLHKITYELTHDSQVCTICVEDLNVKGMTKNHHLSQSINDASFGLFLTILEYKCKWYGINYIKIDRFAPSSKTCCKCGYINKTLKLSDREWVCPHCGTTLDRDFNAAINIKNIGLSIHAKTLPKGLGDVKPVDYYTMDERYINYNLKSSSRLKQ